uniref:NADH-ubiquinone oxidoreductase chain 3 n=1 Tax=Lithophaga curta TaxID=2590090 RepID=A0A516EZI9_9BIVA|nr:NADH dehydrogenase subunit 3 [Lithophaga curta]
MFKVSSLFIGVLFFVFVSVGLILLNVLLSVKGQWNREKVSPYECGFSPIDHARVSFSLRFYVVMILFVIFDVEVVLMVPLIFTLYSVKSFVGVMSWVVFMVLMVLGCLYERRDGSMDWVADSKKWTVISKKYSVRSVPNFKLYGK